MNGGKEFTGKLVGFDDYVNMVLEDVTEIWYQEEMGKRCWRRSRTDNTADRRQRRQETETETAALLPLRLWHRGPIAMPTDADLGALGACWRAEWLPRLPLRPPVRCMQWVDRLGNSRRASGTAHALVDLLCIPLLHRRCSTADRPVPVSLSCEQPILIRYYCSCSLRGQADAGPPGKGKSRAQACRGLDAAAMPCLQHDEVRRHSLLSPRSVTQRPAPYPSNSLSARAVVGKISDYFPPSSKCVARGSPLLACGACISPWTVPCLRCCQFAVKPPIARCPIAAHTFSPNSHPSARLAFLLSCPSPRPPGRETPPTASIACHEGIQSRFLAQSRLPGLHRLCPELPLPLPLPTPTQYTHSPQTAPPASQTST
ncbi:hypothetical protein BDW02DRAFT_644421, partial [Decorospora gaudefroyi]